MRKARAFTLDEFYEVMLRGAEAIPYLQSKKDKGYLANGLKRRIMLAVSSVNGCKMCSYVHTRKALSSGMSPEEIKSILNNEYGDVPVDQAVAVLYAEHYAANREHPTMDAEKRLIEVYGENKAKAIHAACEIISMTTAIGISIDDFKNLFTFKKTHNSIFKGTVILLSMITLFPPIFLYNTAKTWQSKRKGKEI